MRAVTFVASLVILASVDCKGKDERLLRVDPEVAFAYRRELVQDGTSSP